MPDDPDNYDPALDPNLGGSDDNLPAWQVGGDGWEIRWLGGNCPVQGYGSVEGKEWYFRARTDAWTFEVSDAAFVAPPEYHGADLAPDFFDKVFFRTGDDYDNSGWMPLRDAHALIKECIVLYRVTGGMAQPNPYRFTRFPGTP
jgi:hypothetical protein